MTLQEPFGANMGWRTVVGWVVFGVAAIMFALPDGHQLKLVDNESLKVVLGLSAATAGISQRLAQKKQMDLQKALVGVLARSAQIQAVKGASKAARKKGA